MAISPLGGSSRGVSNYHKPDSEPAEQIDDSEISQRGQGVIDNNSEYASMTMLASQLIRRKSMALESEESSPFSERVLDEQADDKINHVEQVLRGETMTSHQLNRFLQGFFPDPSDLLMVVYELLRRKKLSKAMEKTLLRLQKTLQQGAQSRETLSGVNIALTARAFSEPMAKTAGELRMLYREFISYDGPAIYLYQQWIEEMELQEREWLLRFFSRALASDMQGLLPGGLNMMEFAQLYCQVGRLREIQSADAQFVPRLLTLPLLQGTANLSRSVEQLFVAAIRDVVGFGEQLENFMLKHLSVVSLTSKGVFLQKLLTAYSQIAVGVFLSMEQRETLLENLRDYLGQLSQQEVISLSKLQLQQQELE